MRELREEGSVAALAAHDPKQLSTLEALKPQPAGGRRSAIDELWERKRKERGDG